MMHELYMLYQFFKFVDLNDQTPVIHNFFPKVMAMCKQRSSVSCVYNCV